MINDKVASEENVYDDHLDSTQQANYTVENFTKRIEKTMETLVLSERYEAVGPLCRMAIPIYEQRHDYKALVSLYAELQQANSRAAEVKASGKRHLGSYFRVVFLGEQHFGPEHNTEWVYREPKLTSLAEACDRMVESVRHALGHDQVEILPPEKKHIEVARLNLSTAYIQVGHVEPCSAKMLQKNSESDKTGADVGTATVEDDDPMCYRLHTNVKNFVYEERMTDDSVPSTAPEQAKLAVRRIVLTVEKSFPNTRRRQKVLDRTEFILNPLELACDSLLFKAAQIRRILNAAGIMRGAYGFDKSALRRLDVKQLQLFLQGSVSPTVNAGVLAYAEAFTAPEQRHRYGNAGIAKLVSAFKILMTELSDALKINEAAMGSDRSEYQSMLRNSFDGMVERLSAFFNGEKFILDPFAKGSSGTGDDHLDGNAAALHSRSSAMAMHILDSIGGVNT
ncbi:dock homology region 2 domain-containing protein [Ditylenchus destructor]|nr:dock homology region 2 domain-containing protein [Ditylenchus destructor]